MSQRDGRTFDQTRLGALLNPKSVVFIGGSNLVPAVNYARTNNYSGNIYICHPSHNEIAGIKCISSLDDLPVVPDLGFIAVPKEGVCETVSKLSELGVSGVMCNSAGFSEVDGEGHQRQEEFISAAGSMPILGPNCPGFANFFDNSVFMLDHFGDHAGVESGVAVISNGGAYMSDMGCARRSLPIGYLIGLGNQAVLSIADVLEHVLDDDRVKAINLYIESFQDLPQLSRAALKAIQKNIPVVVVKGGSSRAGSRAAVTHTASLTGDQEIASALLNRLGFIQVDTPMQAMETLKMLVHTRRPKGSALAFATTSGSYAVLGADIAEREGLSIPSLPIRTFTKIKSQLPPFVLPGNPLDFSDGQFAGKEAQAQLFNDYFADQYDIALLMMSFPPPGGWVADSWYSTAKNFAGAAEKAGLPAVFINTVPEDLPEDARIMMIENSMAPLMGMDAGIKAISAAVSAVELIMEKNKMEDGEILISDHDAKYVCDVVHYNEVEAKNLLAEVGVSVPKSQIINMDSIVSELNVEFPVVLKAISTDLQHKTEVGGVITHIENLDELNRATKTMSKSLAIKIPELNIETLLVEEMISNSVAELLIGIRRISGVGLVMTLSVGGTMVELLKDTVTIVLPVSVKTIARSIERLKLFPLLNGWRGKSKCDLNTAVSTIQKLAEFVQGNENVIELEINPLLIRPQGMGVVVVDAVLTIVDDTEGDDET